MKVVLGILNNAYVILFLSIPIAILSSYIFTRFFAHRVEAQRDRALRDKGLKGQEEALRRARRELKFYEKVEGDSSYLIAYIATQVGEILFNLGVMVFIAIFLQVFNINSMNSLGGVAKVMSYVISIGSGLLVGFSSMVIYNSANQLIGLESKLADKGEKVNKLKQVIRALEGK